MRAERAGEDSTCKAKCGGAAPVSARELGAASASPSLPASNPASSPVAARMRDNDVGDQAGSVPSSFYEKTFYIP